MGERMEREKEREFFLLEGWWAGLVAKKMTPNLNLIPGTQMVEGEKELLEIVLWLLQVYHGMCALPQTLNK